MDGVQVHVVVTFVWAQFIHLFILFAFILEIFKDVNVYHSCSLDIRNSVINRAQPTSFNLSVGFSPTPAG